MCAVCLLATLDFISFPSPLPDPLIKTTLKRTFRVAQHHSLSRVCIVFLFCFYSLFVVVFLYFTWLGVIFN